MPHSRRQCKKPPTPADDDRPLAELGEICADLTNRRQRAFLAGFAGAGGLSGAERLSGVSRWSHYKWMREEPVYRSRFRLARAIVADDAEEEIYRRAFLGVETPIIYRGKIRGWHKSYSDALAMFWLKAMRPGVYRDNRRDFGCYRGFGRAGPAAIGATSFLPF